MATNNAINLKNAGLANYDGSGNFTGVTVPEDRALIGGANNTILGINPTGFDPGNPICSTGVGTPPAFSATPVCDTITINNLPQNPTDGANKQYVDLVAGSFTFLDSSVCASTINLTANYSNGVAGVGATLTNSGTLGAIQLDGYSPLATNRVLIKNQTNSYENGVYIVSIVGDNLTPWQLTRAADYDTPAEITPGSLVSVLYGNTQANTFWAETQTITNVGVDPILFIQFTIVPSGVLLAANNLNDVDSASASRTNLGLTNVATQNVTHYAVLTGGAADAINSLPVGSAGQVLTSQGPGAFPIWSTGGGGGTGFSGVNIQVITSSSTYTPSTNMLYCIVELVGGGGGGGGVSNPGFNNGAGGGGAGSGGYARKLFDAATIGASQTITIGSGGTPGAPGNNSTFGSFLTCNGGAAGGGGGQAAPGGVGGAASGGDLNVTGAGGASGFGILGANAFVGAQSGAGGSGPWGGGAPGTLSGGNSSNPGNPATGYGGGGGGAAGTSNQAGGFASQPGGAGYQGVCIITEFIGNSAPPPTYSYTLITYADSPYTVSGTDNYIGVDTTGGPVIILLPNTAVQSRTFTIKDKAGDSNTNSITITTVGGTTTIDGATSLTMSTSYQSINLLFGSTAYEVF